MNKSTILVIGSNSNLLDWAVDLLRQSGHLVMQVSNSMDGLVTFHSICPDLVITELEEESGQEVLRSFASISDLTPIIAISDKISNQAIISAFKAGAWDYLLKNKISPLEIGEAVEECLRRAEQKKRTRETEQMLKKLAEDSILHLKRQRNRLQAEIAERKKLERIIEQAKREWEHTIDSIPDFVALIDIDHRIVRLNKSMADAFGMHPRDVIGKRCYELAHQTSQPPDYCPHKVLLNSHKTVRIDAFEKRLGGHIEITVTPFRDPDGTVIGSVHIVRNINHRKEAEAEKERLNLQLLQAHKLEAVGRLAAGIAHEINTPIQYVGSNIEFFQEAFEDISGFIHTIRSTYDLRGSFPDKKEFQQVMDDIDWEYLESEIPSAIDQAKQGIARITKIVRAMKEFSHPGNKEKTLSDINEIIETTVTIAKNEWKYCSDVVLDLQKDLPLTPCLRDELGQVFLNMLVNAAQAISAKLGENPEGDKGRITIKTARDNGNIKIVMTDTGVGIPDEIRHKIFEPFFTTKDVGKGTGQGLAISRDVIVEKHGGTIAVDSVLNEGTTFTITIPLPEDHRVEGAAT